MANKKTSEVLQAFMDALKGGIEGQGVPPHNAPELVDRWSIEMETQVMVLADLGEETEIMGVYEAKDYDARYWKHPSS